MRTFAWRLQSGAGQYMSPSCLIECAETSIDLLILVNTKYHVTACYRHLTTWFEGSYGLVASDMVEGFMKMLQQIQEALTRINASLQARKNQKSRSDAVGFSEAIALPPDVMEESRDCLKDRQCDRLLELVRKHPAKLCLQTFRHDSRSALHVADKQFSCNPLVEHGPNNAASGLTPGFLLDNGIISWILV